MNNKHHPSRKKVCDSWDSHETEHLGWLPMGSGGSHRPVSGLRVWRRVPPNRQLGTGVSQTSMGGEHFWWAAGSWWKMAQQKRIATENISVSFILPRTHNSWRKLHQYKLSNKENPAMAGKKCLVITKWFLRRSEDDQKGNLVAFIR